MDNLLPDEKLADYWSDWLIDAVAGSTQDRRLLRHEEGEDTVLTEAIVANGRKAILSALRSQAKSPVRDCMAYGDILKQCPKLAQQIGESHEWDNMNAYEQQQGALSKAEGLVAQAKSNREFAADPRLVDDVKAAIRQANDCAELARLAQDVSREAWLVLSGEQEPCPECGVGGYGILREKLKALDSALRAQEPAK